MTDKMKRLSEPFHPNDVKFRAGATSERDGGLKALALAYVEARDVMNRLDTVLGWGQWSDEYRILRETKDGIEVECTLTIGDVSRSDAGIGDDAKAAYSDALKRAAVKFGVGRYLYRLPKQWVDAKKSGKYVYLKSTPKLPYWALPDELGGAKKGKAKDVPPMKLNEQFGKLPDPVGSKFPAGFKVRTTYQNKQLHTLGKKFYGDNWSAERPRLCKWISDNRTSSSAELSFDECKKLIAGLEAKLATIEEDEVAF